MSLQYLIDGYNIINHPQFCRNRKKEQSVQVSLLNLIKIKKLCGSTKNKAVLVFDGFSSEAGSGRYDEQFSIVFSQNISADEYIKRAVEVSKNKKIIIVVSDDKQIASFIRYAGAQALSVGDFLRAGVGDKIQETDDSLNYTQISQINEELKKKWGIV